MNRREYIAQFLLLFAGNASAQLVNLLSYPLLSRLYSPLDFGGFALFVSASAIPATLACARFELAIPTAPRYGRFAIYWLALSASVFIGILAGIVSGIYWLIHAQPNALAFSMSFGVTVLATGFCNASTAFLLRHGLFKLTSISLFVRTTMAIVIQMGLSFWLRSPAGLILGFCGGLVAQVAILAPAILKLVRGRRPRVMHMAVLFRQYRAQVTLDAQGTILSTVSLNIMPFCIKLVSGVVSVGYYSVAQRIAVLPLSLFNDGWSQVYFQRAARAYEERGTFWSETKFTILVSIGVSLLTIAGIWLLAHVVVEAYLGKRWAPAATVLIILAPMLAVRNVAMSIGTAVFILKRPSWLLIHNVANVALTAIAVVFALYEHTGLYGYLEFYATLLSAEFLVFGVMLGYQVYRKGTMTWLVPSS